MYTLIAKMENKWLRLSQPSPDTDKLRRCGEKLMNEKVIETYYIATPEQLKTWNI